MMSSQNDFLSESFTIAAPPYLMTQRLHRHPFLALFDGGRYRPAPLADSEVRALRQMEGHSLSHPEQPDWVRLNVQEWVAPHLKEAYGEAPLPPRPTERS